MLNIRPTCHLITRSRRLHFSQIPFLTKTFPLTLTLRQTPLSLSYHHKPRLSLSSMTDKRPSVFEALMSGARKAAAASKKKPPVPSPKKRKSPEPISQNPNSDAQNPSSKSPDEFVAKPDVINGANLGSGESAPSNKELKVSCTKKPRVAAIDLDAKIAQLKKKPSDFVSESVAWWDEGQKIPFLFFARALDSISKESGRIVITDIVCNVLQTVIATTPDDLLPVVYLLANKISSAHEGLEFGIGEAVIKKALAEAYGCQTAVIKSKYEKLGDLGLVAQELRSSQSTMLQPAPLTVAKVFDTFRLIAKTSGKDSQERKKNYMKLLLVAAKDCEPVYLIRLLQTKLRIGLAEQTLLAALGQAAVRSEKHSVPPKGVQSPMEEGAKIVKQVFSVLPVYDIIIPALLSGGVWELPKTCSFTPGVPIGPMLAKPTKGISEIIDKFQDMEFTCEYKYDGERAQIHYLEDGKVEIYSRNAERNTEKFPDVVLAASRFKKPSISSFVMDCEVVAIERGKNKILPFQTLSTRARKNVVLSEIKVEVCIFAFDLLYLNGKSLLQDQLDVRRKLLYESFVEEPGYFQFATAITSSDLEEIQKFLEASVDGSCEGLIIKTLNTEATYEPSKRSNNWLKLKKDYMERILLTYIFSIGDSLDLVPIGAFHGRGKRTGVYGAFLLACYDSNNEEFQSICKIGTGFSEQVLEERSSSLRSKVIPNPKSYYRYGDSLEPDVWFEPSEVWEVKAADLTISPVHRAAVGIVDNDKGISLRFPRLVRIREDKNPEQASSSEQVAELFSAQKNNHRNNKDEAEDD
ncbi:hypothetical protein V2J09_002495 [Rumex salicifolius]